MTDGFDIDELTFKEMEQNQQLWILFKTFNTHRINCEDRFCKLENHKKIDTAVAGGSGLVGGFLAVLGKWFFFK